MTALKSTKAPGQLWIGTGGQYWIGANSRIDALIKNGKASMREAAYRPVAGTMLSRLYQGKQYQVIATPDGTYEFDGRPFESLSKIAYEITGTRWSGPLFFGLRARPDTKASPKKGARA